MKTRSSLNRVPGVVQYGKVDPVTHKRGRITDCNGKNACGDPNLMAAICSKASCGTPLVDTCLNLHRETSLPYAVIETPHVSWNHALKRGFWCMPCCILEDNNHPKMKVCSEMPTQGDICKQNFIHGRCGIDFNP